MTMAPSRIDADHLIRFPSSLPTLHQEIEMRRRTGKQTRKRRTTISKKMFKVGPDGKKDQFSRLLGVV